VWTLFLGNVFRPQWLFQREWFGFKRTVSLLEQDLHLVLGTIQFLLALRRQPHTFLEHFDRIFQGQVTALKLRDNPFQIFQ